MPRGDGKNLACDLTMFEQLFKGFIIIGKIWNFHTVCLEASSANKLLINFFSKIYYGSNTWKSSKTVLYAPFADTDGVDGKYTYE